MIDPDAGTVAPSTWLPSTHGAVPLVIHGATWLYGNFEGVDGSPLTGLVLVDPASGAPDRWVAMPGVDGDNAVVASGALWLADEARHRVLRYDLASLTGQ